MKVEQFFSESLIIRLLKPKEKKIASFFEPTFMNILSVEINDIKATWTSVFFQVIQMQQNKAHSDAFALAV